MDNTTGRALLNLGLDLADVRRHQALLQQYFQRDEAKRFELVSAISSGQYSVAWKLKFRETPTSDVRYIVLKTDRKYTELRNDDDDSQDDDDNKNMDVDDDSLMSPESQTPNEKNRLEALQWAKHVVSGVEVTSDPLGRVFPDVPSHQMDPDSWLYIEYLENGTISNFLQKARQKKMVIPNRILWRFFMCLLRMVVAMGWPPAKPDGEEPKPVQEQISGPPTGGLRHNDMHEENIMLGNMIQSGDADLEHSLTPILCLIDLGAMDKVPDTPEHNMAAVRSNIFDIGLIMLSLITRNEELAQSIVPEEETAIPIQLRRGQPPVLTNATPLLAGANWVTPFGWLDPDLRTALCACLATLPEQRPSIAALLNVVTNCIKERDQGYYAARYRNDGASESDARIRTVMQELVFNA